MLEKPEPDVCVKSGNVTTLLLVTFEQSGIVSGRPDEAGGRDGNNNISMYTNWHPSHGSECFAAGGRLSLSMCGIYIYIQGRKTRHRRVGRVVGGGDRVGGQTLRPGPRLDANEADLHAAHCGGRPLVQSRTHVGPSRGFKVPE